MGRVHTERPQERGCLINTTIRTTATEDELVSVLNAGVAGLIDDLEAAS